MYSAPLRVVCTFIGLEVDKHIQIVHAQTRYSLSKCKQRVHTCINPQGTHWDCEVHLNWRCLARLAAMGLVLRQRAPHSPRGPGGVGRRQPATAPLPCKDAFVLRSSIPGSQLCAGRQRGNQ